MIVDQSKRKNLAFLFLMMSLVCFWKANNLETFIKPTGHHSFIVEPENIEEHYTIHPYSHRGATRKPEDKNGKADL